MKFACLPMDGYDQYLRLPHLRKLWTSKEFPNWNNELILKPALQALGSSVSLSVERFRKCLGFLHPPPYWCVGLSDSQLYRIINIQPRLLLCDPVKSILSKLDLICSPLCLFVVLMLKTFVLKHLHQTLAYNLRVPNGWLVVEFLCNLATVQLRSVYELNIEVADCVLEKANRLCKDLQDVKVEKRAENGDPRDVISEMSEKLAADMLVMGSHGYDFIKRAFLGSVSNHCAQNVKCPILIVKKPKAAAGAGDK